MAGRVINNRFKYCQDMENSETYAHQITDVMEKLQNYQKKGKELNEEEGILGVALTDYSEIGEFMKVGEPLKTLWSLVR